MNGSPVIPLAALQAFLQRSCVPDACDASFRPLDNTPTRLINYGDEKDVCPGERPITVLDTRVHCAVGEILAIVFSVLYESANPYCRLDDLDPNEPTVLLRAHLFGGLGCMPIQAVFDIRQGTVVALPTETVRVDVEAIVIPPAGVAPSDVLCPEPVKVGVGVGYGCGREYAKLTEPVRVAPAAKGRVPIPPYASRFLLLPSGTTTLTVRAVTSGGAGPFPEYTQSGPATAGRAPFPLPNGTRFLEVDGPAEGFIVFGLDI